MVKWRGFTGEEYVQNNSKMKPRNYLQCQPLALTNMALDCLSIYYLAIKHHQMFYNKGCPGEPCSLYFGFVNFCMWIFVIWDTIYLKTDVNSFEMSAHALLKTNNAKDRDYQSMNLIIQNQWNNWKYV